MSRVRDLVGRFSGRQGTNGPGASAGGGGAEGTGNSPSRGGVSNASSPLSPPVTNENANGNGSRLPPLPPNARIVNQTAHRGGTAASDPREIDDPFSAPSSSSSSTGEGVLNPIVRGGSFTSGSRRPSAAERRNSAIEAMSNRRTSITATILQESRQQDERGEEGMRMVKRPSMTNMMMNGGSNTANHVNGTTTTTTTTHDAPAGNEEPAVVVPNPPDHPPPPLVSDRNGQVPPASQPTLETTVASSASQNTALASPSSATVVSNVSSVTAAETTVTGGSGGSKLGTSSTGAKSSSNKDQQTATSTQNFLNNITSAAPPPGRMSIFPKLENLPLVAKELASGVPERQLIATITVRVMLTSNSDWIQNVVDTPGVIPRLVEFLSRDHQRRLQLEATWALTNIASGTSAHTDVVVRAGALEWLVRLLDSPAVEIREQAVWAIGNISGDSPDMRDVVLSHGAMPALVNRLDLELMSRKQHLSLIRNAVWAVANLCRGKPPPRFDLVKECIPVLGRVIQTNDIEMQADACWALNYLGDGDNIRVQAIIDAGVCPRLIELLEHDAPVVKTPALRAVGNVVTGDDSQTEYILGLGALERLKVLLSDARHTIRGEASWTISNITAGNHTHIERVIEAGIIPPLVECARDPEAYVSKEAVWAITNATTGGTTEQVIQIGRAGGLAGLCGALENAEELNNRIVLVALDGISNFLTAGDVVDPSNNEFIPVLRACGGERLLRDDLRHHVNDDVRLQAQEIVTRFLDYDPNANGSGGARVKPQPETWTPAEIAEQKERAKREAEEQKRKDEEREEFAAMNAGSAARRRGSVAVPPQFYCPISQELMVDPVSTVDGHVYDRINIQRWFNTGKMTSPVTGNPLASTLLVPNHPLRQMIEAFKPGWTHRADTDTEWNCVACTSINKPTDCCCTICGAEKPLRRGIDPDAAPAIQRVGGGGF